MKSHTKLIYGFATLLAVCWLVPVYLIGISAFSARKSVNAWPKSWWPSEFSLDTLQFFTNFTGVWQAVGNSVIVAIITMVLSIVLGARPAMRWRVLTSRGKRFTACSSS